MRFDGETIWIIGASSGIGEALAHELARRGASLILSARREAQLQSLQEGLGGEVHRVVPLDVSDAQQVRDVARDIGPVDRMVHLAALYDPSAIRDIDVANAAVLVQVNLLGTLHVAQAALEIFTSQKRGQIVLCGSVAGYVGLPKGQLYSATKAGVRNFAESLYAEAPDHVDVKLISPGFVRTPMTDKNDFDMPMRIEPEDAATAIADGLTNGAFEIHFPKRFTILLKLIALLPNRLRLALTRRL